MDQYRVTREMPLPYPPQFEIREESENENEDEDDDDDETLYAEPWCSRILCCQYIVLLYTGRAGPKKDNI